MTSTTLHGYLGKMDKAFSSLVAAFAIASLSSDALAAAVAPQSIKGPGITKSTRVNGLSIYIHHAQAGKSRATAGEFVAVHSRLTPSDNQTLIPQYEENVVCILNLYKVTRTVKFTQPPAVPTETVSETLVYRGVMTEGPKLAVVLPPNTPDATFFSTTLDSVIRSAGNLFGEYRAEVVAYVIPRTSGWTYDGKTLPPARYEVAGSDALFNIASDVNLVPVSEVLGGFRVTPSVSIAKSATAAQRSAINARVLAECARIQKVISNYCAKHSSTPAGAPSRSPWQHVLWISTKATDAVNVSMLSPRGEIYTSDKAKIAAEVAALIRPLSVKIAMPNGSISISTTSDITFEDL